MKKIVVCVSSSLPDDQTESSFPEQDPTEATPGTPEVSRSNSDPEGTVRFEAVLPDKRINQVVDILLQADGTSNEAESLVNGLLRSQFRDSPEEDQGIFHRVLSDVEKELLRQAFEECNHVKTKTAARLGIDRNTLHKKLQRYGLIESDDEKELENEH